MGLPPFGAPLCAEHTPVTVPKGKGLREAAVRSQQSFDVDGHTPVCSPRTTIRPQRSAVEGAQTASSNDAQDPAAWW